MWSKLASTIRRAVILALVVLAGCSRVRAMTPANAPPNPGCCSTALAMGNRVLVVYALGTKAKTYEIDANVWRDANPPTAIKNLVGAGDFALDVRRDETLVYDGRLGRWEQIPGPSVAWTRLVVDGSRVIAAPALERFGPVLAGAMVFDPDTRRWHRIPDGPDAPRPRDAPWLFVGSTLVWLPGAGRCPSTCPHPEHPALSVEPIEPGATWTIGAPRWQPMATGPVGFRHRDVAVALGDRLIALAQLGRGYVTQSDALVPRQAETGWWQFALSENRWSRISAPGAPLLASSASTGKAIVAADHAFVFGDSAPAIYDATRNTWTPAPPQLAKASDYVLSADRGRILTLDGNRRPAYLFDLAAGARLPLDTSGFSDPQRPGRSFQVKLWTGRCFVFWGETRSSANAANQCSNRPPNMGCDPAPVATKPSRNGNVWCLP